LQAEERRQLVMTTLWQRMGEMFGNQWELNFGKPGGPSYLTWTEGLAGYSEAQIRNGVEHCRTWDSKGFVPNLPQFAGLCLTRRSVGPNITAERIEREANTPLLEKLRHSANTPIAKHELGRIERIMAGEEVETKEESYRKLGLHVRWGSC